MLLEQETCNMMHACDVKLCAEIICGAERYYDV